MTVVALFEQFAQSAPIASNNYMRAMPLKYLLKIQRKKHLKKSGFV